MSALAIISDDGSVTRLKPLLWFAFDQNNSGGYFERDENVSETVYIQATSAAEAIAKAETFMTNDGSCPCCGDRWSFWLDDADGTAVPMQYGEPAESTTASFYRSEYKMHFVDGHVESHKFGEARTQRLGSAA